MRLHSNVITMSDIHKALNECITAGTIAPQVNFKALTRHNSQSHANAFEVQLEAASRKPGDGRRAGNSGSYGAMDGSNGYAATYDEWGWVMAALYSIDPDAVWGSVRVDVRQPGRLRPSDGADLQSRGAVGVPERTERRSGWRRPVPVSAQGTDRAPRRWPEVCGRRLPRLGRVPTSHGGMGALVRPPDGCGGVGMSTELRPETFAALVWNIQRRAAQLAAASSDAFDGLNIVELDYQLEDIGTILDIRAGVHND